VARVSIRYTSVRDARAVSSAVAPDNAKIPKGLDVKTCQAGRKVTSTITCAAGLDRLASTLDDLLECTLAAERAIVVLRAQSSRAPTASGKYDR
jgi:hypothetical protein